MDFNYTEDQIAIKDVADRIFRDLGSDEIIKSCFTQAKPFHQALWEQLAASGMLAVPLSEEFGGSGLGLTELGIVLEGQGKVVAPLPLIETIIECAMPIEKFATADLKKRLIPGVVTGELKLSFVRPYQGLQRRQPLIAEQQDNVWVLNGYSDTVRYAGIANGFVVSAKLKDGRYWVGYCDANTAGIAIAEQLATSGEPIGHIEFNNVSILNTDTIALADEAQALIEWKNQRLYAAVAAQQVGVLAEGLRRAAEYTTERTQFGKPLASFQAVAQQAADAYMAIEALRGVYWRAIDDIDNGRNAQMSARVAKFWTAEAGHIAAHIFLHIHGGIGQDLEYPLHRFFSWAKNNESHHGAALQQSVALGQIISATPEKVLL